MKKTLLTISLLTFALFNAKAQCTIVTGCTPDAQSGYCTTPATTTALPIGGVNLAYSTTIQLSLGTTAGGGAATISNATINSVTGLPAGLTYSFNPANGFIMAGQSACILISGTPAIGSNGNYSVTVNVSATTNFGQFPGSANWSLQINTTTGIKSIVAPIANLYLAPNPAKNELYINSELHLGKIQIIDALGKVVLENDANYAIATTLDVSTLERGVYFLQVNNGNKIITKKFIKE